MMNGVRELDHDGVELGILEAFEELCNKTKDSAF